MPTPTYDLLATLAPSAGASQAEFTNLNTLAAGYRDLIVVMDLFGNSFAPFDVRVNSSSANIYRWQRISGFSGSEAADTSTQTFWRMGAASLDTGQRGITTLHLMDFARTDRWGMGIARTSKAQREADIRVLSWESTSAITSIQMYFDGNTFPANCKINLYGVVA